MGKGAWHVPVFPESATLVAPPHVHQPGRSLNPVLVDFFNERVSYIDTVD